MTQTRLALTIFLSFFALLAVGVFLLPRGYIYLGAPDQARWRDLRLWALVLVILHACVYWYFS